MATCKGCNGSGVIYDRKIKPGSTGELKLCACVEKKCSCGGVPPYQKYSDSGEFSWCTCRVPRIKLNTIKKAFRDSEIPKKYKWKFMEDFRDVSPKETTRKKLSTTSGDIMGTLSTLFRDPQIAKLDYGFYLWGPAGAGKTLLACIILQELMLKYGLAGKYIDLSRQFFQRLRQSFDVSDETYGSAGRILDDLIKAPFLVIDDFGVQRNTEWESEMLYNLIDSRYSEESITIITSNFNISEYEKVAEGRISSRIREMCRIVHVNLPDYRKNFSKEL